MTKWRIDKLLLKHQAWDFVEEGLYQRGFKSRHEERIEGSDPYPNKISDIEKEGYAVQLDPEEKWGKEWKRWCKHFQILDPKNMEKLAMRYDKNLHILYLLNTDWITGGINYAN